MTNELRPQVMPPRLRAPYRELPILFVLLVAIASMLFSIASWSPGVPIIDCSKEPPNQACLLQELTYASFASH